MEGDGGREVGRGGEIIELRSRTKVEQGRGEGRIERLRERLRGLGVWVGGWVCVCVGGGGGGGGGSPRGLRAKWTGEEGEEDVDLRWVQDDTLGRVLERCTSRSGNRRGAGERRRSRRRRRNGGGEA